MAETRQLRRGGGQHGGQVAGDVAGPVRAGRPEQKQDRGGDAGGRGGQVNGLGHYPRDERLPSESELMREFEVGRTTVRLAIAELRKRGLAETVSTRGTYVVKELPAPAAD
ncbi:MAG TPA: winged helix-turn-helix domain-containing protein [Streptosporangiaceae bacterium]